MAINFPDSPSDNDIYTVNGKRWIYSSGKWSIYGSTAPDATASDTEPSGVGDGHIWYRSDQSQTLIRYDNTWVEVGSAGGFDNASTNFPTSLDSATGFAAVEALQAKVGVDSSAVTSSHDYLIADHASRITTLESASGGKILQVVHAVQTSEFASSATSFVDVTGSSASITPSSASSKVLVLVHGSLSMPNNLIVDFTVFRGNAATGTNLGHSSFGFGRPRIPGAGGIIIISAATLDSPATTSSVTYQLAMKCQTATAHYYGTSGSHATVTLMEVAA